MRDLTPAEREAVVITHHAEARWQERFGGRVGDLRQALREARPLTDSEYAWWSGRPGAQGIPLAHDGCGSLLVVRFGPGGRMLFLATVYYLALATGRKYRP
jgi:hypothetical protein